MAASSFYNRVKYTPTLGGTADFATSAAVSGFRTPATASIPDGTLVSYVAFSSNQSEWETGQGAYTVATTTIARTTIRESSNAGAKVSFTAAPTVALDLQAQDVALLAPLVSPSFTTPTLGVAAGTSLALGGATIGSNALAVTGMSALAGQITNALGAITTSQPFTLTQTWNAAGVTFTGILENITNTASAAASLLLDLQVASVSKFKIKIDSTVQIGSGGFEVSTTPTAGAATRSVVVSDSIYMKSTATFSWSSSATDVVPLDLILSRDAAAILAQRNGTNAQASRLAATWTDASNYEYLRMDAGKTTANTHRIMSEAAGTGTVRIITIDGFDKAGAAAASDIPAGTWALIHDTSGATFKLCYNNAGALKTVALT